MSGRLGLKAKQGRNPEPHSRPLRCASLMGTARAGGVTDPGPSSVLYKPLSAVWRPRPPQAAPRPSLSQAGMQRPILFPGEKVVPHLITDVGLKAL